MIGGRARSTEDPPDHMATSHDWSLAYAKQARSDWDARQALLKDAKLPACHQLHFLQMACEKLCKAYLCAYGSNPEDLQSSHAYVGKVLPVVFRMRVLRGSKRTLKSQAWLLKYVESIAREIELLAPAVKDGGRRQDNCEYPWEDGAGNVLVPSERQFPNLQKLHERESLPFFKFVLEAIEEFGKASPPRPGPDAPKAPAGAPSKRSRLKR